MPFDKDKNGITLLPDLAEINLEEAFVNEQLITSPLDVEANLSIVLEEANQELMRIVN